MLLSAYKKVLVSSEAFPNYIFRSCVPTWKEHYSDEKLDMSASLDLALSSPISRRLWEGEKYSIKSSLLKMAKGNPEFFWSVMKDLLNEDKMLIMRVNRYIHHCDEIQMALNRGKPLKDSHHQDYYAAMLYLSLQYPERYCLYRYEDFASLCSYIEVQDLPIDGDLERYYKIVNAVYNIAMKDQELMERYYQKLPDQFYLGPSKCIVLDLMQVSKTLS